MCVRFTRKVQECHCFVRVNGEKSYKTCHLEKNLGDIFRAIPMGTRVNKYLGVLGPITLSNITHMLNLDCLSVSVMILM